jgi:hypothetical protein
MSILALTSNTLTSPAVAGQIEYASPILAATPIGTQRGIVPTQQYYRLDSALAGANATGAQSTFGVGATLSSSTVYEFEMVFTLSKSAGTTSHFINLGFGGTATLNNIASSAFSPSVVPATGSAGAINSFLYTSATLTQVTSALTTAAVSWTLIIKGTVSVNAGGTFIPQYSLSAAPGGAYSTAAGSFIRIAPIGASGAATNVGTWA